jgi:hypothetical protein
MVQRYQKNKQGDIMINEPLPENDEDVVTIKARLMQHTFNRSVVLFTSKRSGTVVKFGNDPNGYPVGHHSDVWAHECFKDFSEEVVLKNLI